MKATVRPAITIDDTAKSSMEEFLKDTTEMIREKLTFTEKLRVMLKYSL